MWLPEHSSLLCLPNLGFEKALLGVCVAGKGGAEDGLASRMGAALVRLICLVPA